MEDVPGSYHESFRLEDEEGNASDEAQSLGESLLSHGETGDGETMPTNADSVPDVMLLNLYCAHAKPPRETEESRLEAEESWQPVRQWLSSHNAEEVRTGAEQKGESGLTALHFACRHVPPLDVIEVILSIAADTVRWPDSFGWLPIHYACASGSDSEVIKALAENFPESKTAVDRRGRTPLHFALGDRPADPDVIFLLSSSGAASYADEIGMLPLHYACAFGASEEVLYVLTEAYPEAIKSKDKRHRTPLHFALSNAGRKTVPSAVRLLLSLDREIANSIDNGPLPLRVLAEYARTIKGDDEKKEEKRESVSRCMEYLLNAEPDATADFLTALQSLPDWLSERAVVMPVVQFLLNDKISRRFPTAVLMLDFYVIAMTIISYSLNVVESITRRSSDMTGEVGIPGAKLIPLYLSAAYFAMREIIQIISLVSLKSFNIWLYDPNNYFNVAFAFLMLFWAIRMQTGTGETESFRIGATVSAVIVWVKLLAYLRNVMIDFAVFVGGVFYVIRRLAAFLTALGIILIAFAQMFFTVYQQSDYCINQPNNSLPWAIIVEYTKCNNNEIHPYCTFWNSFFIVYDMLLGDVYDRQYLNSGVAIFLFVVFMFLVVILLGNVLIAIVTDSYKVVQDQRAAIVFWTNRLDFIAEMDGITNGPWIRRVRKAIGCGSEDARTAKSRRSEATFGKELWKTMMDLFIDDVEEGIFSLEFVAYTVLRILAVIIVPLWLVLGMFTVGWLWPPQVREAVFTSTVSKHSSDSEKQNELRKTQVKQLEQEVKVLYDELLQELALDRTHIVQLKSHITERKMEIASEMRDIKRMAAMLFERAPTMYEA